VLQKNVNSANYGGLLEDNFITICQWVGFELNKIRVPFQHDGSGYTLVRGVAIKF
jgi:hypothetical protein